MVWTDEQQRKYEEYLAYLDAREPDEDCDVDDDDQPPTAAPMRANSLRITRLDATGNPIPGSESVALGDVRFTISTQQSHQVDAIQQALRGLSERLRPLGEVLGQVRASRGTHDRR